ncbi:uncharacterized protein LOC143275080 [Babylonia areolata]|uniref:uncharacterized protein LOC143275080 n=1 Tax=Babylonia areolata TaxID=304850 RepID=UPI003FD653A8
MLPRKTGPAPIFNYRKRPRQAVVADPETHPSNAGLPHCSGPAPPPAGRLSASAFPGQPVVYASTSCSSFGRGGSRSATGTGSGLAPPPAGKISAFPGQPVVQGNWRSTDTRQGQNSVVSIKEWKTGPMSARPLPAQPAMPGPSGTMKRQQPLYQPPLHQPSRSSVNTGGGRSVSPMQQNTAPQKVQKSIGGGDRVRDATKTLDKSLRVLTLPIAHLKRAFGLPNDTMPAFLFCLFGIVDSATVWDRRSSGKSFTLRDETGRITCIFCEIDRQMPRLHRGQWYRVVGVARHSWQALQCVSLRPVSLEERQAARAVISTSTALLNDLCMNVREM